ncbi:MAG: PIN domain-containing protein [bacterium]
MYLLDTNVWLERLLEQERSEEVANFLNRFFSEQLFITDFAFHSIGLILDRLNKTEIFLKFIKDIFIEGSVSLIHLEVEDMDNLTSLKVKYDLDFDDAYQYVAAERYSLIFISFDRDFDKTDKGRKTPNEILNGLS